MYVHIHVYVSILTMNSICIKINRYGIICSNSVSSSKSPRFFWQDVSSYFGAVGIKRWYNINVNYLFLFIDLAVRLLML